MHSFIFLLNFRLLFCLCTELGVTCLIQANNNFSRRNLPELVNHFEILYFDICEEKELMQVKASILLVIFHIPRQILSTLIDSLEVYLEDQIRSKKSIVEFLTLIQVSFRHRSSPNSMNRLFSYQIRLRK